MVNVWFPYGKTEVCARIPTRNFLGAITPKDKPCVADPEEEIIRTLKHPIDSKPLAELVKPGDTIAIVVDDATRPAPSKLLIPPLLKELNNCGVKDSDITILFGCGTHRPVTPKEAGELLGEEVVKRIKTLGDTDEQGRSIRVWR